MTDRDSQAFFAGLATSSAMMSAFVNWPVAPERTKARPKRNLNATPKSKQRAQRAARKKARKRA